MFASSPFTDVIFMFEGIEWLKWLVAFFFFMLGLFMGWWQWAYRPAISKAAAPPEQSISSRILAGQKTHEEKVGGLGFVYESQPDEIDDLQQIRGVGRALRAKLYSLGIYRFEQIANWTESEIATASKKLQLVDQIEKEDWCEQAKSLHSKSANS